MSELIPVTVVGGYLGAGKTTLVNHLLRHAHGWRIAVLVNDFGELPIDADLIEARGGDVIGIAGGCVCCSFGSDLLAALVRMADLSPRPDQVLIEASGVALPGSVARSVALLAAFRLDATVVLADAETVRARAADRYVGDTVTRQLLDANLVVLSKCDLVNAATLEELDSWLRAQAPQARAVRARRGEVCAEVILGVAPREWRATAADRLIAGGMRVRVAAPAATRFESVSLRPAQPLDLDALGAALTDPALGVLRAKGVLRDRSGGWKALHVVGSRWEVADHASVPSAAALVCIGLAGMLDAERIEALSGLHPSR